MPRQTTNRPYNEASRYRPPRHNTDALAVLAIATVIVLVLAWGGAMLALALSLKGCAL